MNYKNEKHLNYKKISTLIGNIWKELECAPLEACLFMLDNM